MVPAMYTANSARVDGYAPGHRDSDLAAHGNQRGEHGAKHHAADIVRFSAFSYSSC